MRAGGRGLTPGDGKPPRLEGMHDHPRSPEPTTAHLLEVLGDLAQPAELRHQAALEVGRRADSATASTLVGLLWREPEFFVRETIVWGLVRMDRSWVPAVLEALHDDRAVVREQAVHALSKIDGHPYADDVWPLLDDPSPKVSLKARWMLARVHDARLLPRLVAQLGSRERAEHDMVTQLLAGYEQQAVAPLLDVVHDAAQPIAHREHALEVLATIGSPAADAAIEPLRAFIADTPDAGLAVSALMALTQFDADAARAVIAQAQRDERPQVAELAHRLVVDPPRLSSAARLRALKRRRGLE